ncbi:hypothetical protein [Metabacillus litoralis]|uniref:hypothetical protein n=1 Tax=Metabacillus litoralis TaxID=152268 RepID=UPI001CFE7BAF|nr:hypothetical protein [Metabacillus litoralis]
MVKKFSISICTLLLLLIAATPLETKALTIEELPVKQSSKQWSVQIGEAEKGKDLAKQMNDGNSYHGANFLMAEIATELEVEIIWTQDKQGRPLKETFTFTAE